MDTASLTSTPLHRGAEADLSLTTIGPWKVVVKCRVRKDYRNPILDERIRHDRTISEASVIHEAKTAGARVASIVGVDIENNAIVMTHLAGTVARECLDDMGKSEAQKLLRSIGEQIGLLHTTGIVHGDLTTSNVIVSPSGAPFIVDFGMSRRSVEPEDRGSRLQPRKDREIRGKSGLGQSDRIIDGRGFGIIHRGLEGIPWSLLLIRLQYDRVERHP